MKDRMTKDEGQYLARLTQDINSYSEEELDALLKKAKWQSQGKTGTAKPRKRFLTSLDTDHLENILVTQSHVPPLYRKLIVRLFKQRIQEHTLENYCPMA